MKKGNLDKRGKIIIGVLLSAVALCFILVNPWIFVIVIFIAIGILMAILDDTKAKDRTSRAGRSTAPLSAAINNDIRIMQECVSFLNTSDNLQTVIHRYDDLLVVLNRLCEYEKNAAVSFPHELPSDVLRRIESEKPQIMNRAIQRAYDSMLRKCAALKTERGRKNRQMRFFDELNALMPNFPEETRDFAIDFINKNIDDPLTGLEGL